MSNVIKFPNVKEESSDFVETDKVRVWNTIYQIPVKVKIPITAESDDEEMIRQIFISLCEYYRFDHANTDHKTNPDDNATIFIFSINIFFFNQSQIIIIIVLLCPTNIRMIVPIFVDFQ